MDIGKGNKHQQNNEDGAQAGDAAKQPRRRHLAGPQVRELQAEKGEEGRGGREEERVGREKAHREGRSEAHTLRAVVAFNNVVQIEDGIALRRQIGEVLGILRDTGGRCRTAHDHRESKGRRRR